MLILAIDTSAVASAALVSDDTLECLVGSFSTEDTRSHAEVLAPGIEALLAEAGMTGADIDAVVTGVGPGPLPGCARASSPPGPWPSSGASPSTAS